MKTSCLVRPTAVVVGRAPLESVNVTRDTPACSVNLR